MQISNWVEILGAAFSIVYSLLLMREKSIGWWFGIASSLIGVWLFYQSKIYAQAMISFYFVLVGCYGLWYWKQAEKQHQHIAAWPAKNHLVAVVIFTILSLLSAYFFSKYTNSSSPYFDSFVTLFGLLASIKEAHKILSSWIYWFLINAASVVLYYQQGLYYYAVLMIVYSAICIPGYLNWLRIYKLHKNDATK